MVDTVAIYRPGPMAFNSTTGLNAATSVKKIYEGHARIYSVEGPSLISVGEADLVFRQTYISIPADVLPAPIRDDIVKVLEGRSDEDLLDKAFRVMDVSGGGIVRAVRRLLCQTLEENAQWQP